jgi:glycosyltransferase involved in cell wall biosynthesis
MKIAIVHDWLTTYAGAERVLENLLVCFPEADLFTVVDFLPQDQRSFLRDKLVTTTFIQKLPFAKKYYRNFLPLMPLAIEQLDLSAYDLILSSSHAVAKGVITGPEQIHISYVHSPMRYAWDLQHQYLQESNLTHGVKSWLTRYFLHKMRLWDCRTANGVDYFIANSAFIAQRIFKTYRRDAAVIYPPVDVNAFSLQTSKEDFYLTAARLVPYKKIDLIVAAFAAMPDKKLVVIGDGPQMAKIRRLVTDNITLMGYQPQKILCEKMQAAKAFVFAAIEDFGLAPVEAQACGTPVIALNRGGCRETVMGADNEKPTGLFFSEQTTTAIIDAVQRFENLTKKIDAEHCRANALQFAATTFQKNIKQYVQDIWTKKNYR